MDSIDEDVHNRDRGDSIIEIRDFFKCQAYFNEFSKLKKAYTTIVSGQHSAYITKIKPEL